MAYNICYTGQKVNSFGAKEQVFLSARRAQSASAAPLSLCQATLISIAIARVLCSSMIAGVYFSCKEFHTPLRLDVPARDSLL